MADKKWVYLFDEVEEVEKTVGSDWENVRALLGGKGAGLADMTRAKVPVPPGFTVTTEACNAYLAEDEKFPAGMWEQELAAMKKVEEKTGKKFGDPQKPLFVSCRSGAKFSMPGMMDTVLNIGLNDQTAGGMVSRGMDLVLYTILTVVWSKCLEASFLGSKMRLLKSRLLNIRKAMDTKPILR